MQSTSTKPVIIVGGYPRSGTTLTHALICTSQKASNYHPEASFLKSIFIAYQTGIGNWNAHTSHLFPDVEAFRQDFENVFDLFLGSMEKKVGSPEVWSLKDPLLTPYFHWVGQVLRDRVKFVTVVRRPHEVIRSNIEVMTKMNRPCELKDVREMARQYNQYYKHIDNAALKDRLFVLRYEDIGSDDTIQKLRKFTGLKDIETDNVWKDEAPAKNSDNPWFSPKYKAKIDLAPRLDALDQNFSQEVEKICAPLLKRFYGSRKA